MSNADKIKSPFLVFQEFLSDDECDRLAKQVRVDPTLDQNGVPQPMQRFYPDADAELIAKLKPLIPSLEKHYGLKYKGTERPVFQQFPANSKQAEPPHCESSVYKRKKWVKIKDRDLTGILWLKNFQSQPPFNLKNDVLGGKLEFPVYQFGFQAQKGTLVIYPAGERFISLTTPVLVGELQCVRFHIAAEGIWLYKPDDFEGDYRTWFSHII